jgi:hypothetical protein
MRLDIACTRYLWNYMVHLRCLRLCNIDLDLSTAQHEPPCWSEMLECTIKQSLTIDDNIVIQVIRGTPKLSIFKIVHCAKITSKIIYTAASLCTKLSHLTLTELAISDRSAIYELGWMTLAYANPDLVEIHLSLPAYMSDQVIENITTLCQHLRSLDLGSAPHLTDTALFHIATYCPELEMLCIEDAYAITSVGIFNVTQH